jgi:hypothetical protein
MFIFLGSGMGPEKNRYREYETVISQKQKYSGIFVTVPKGKVCLCFG